MKVLAVAAHPDDETLGVGGTLLKHLAAGDELGWLLVVRGTEEDWGAEFLEKAHRQIDIVKEAYPFSHFWPLSFPAARLDTVPRREIIEAIRKVLEEFSPEIVYTVGDHDIHSDHDITCRALAAAVKPFRTSEGPREIYSYEVLSSTEQAFGVRPDTFVPNTYSDISEFIERKLEIMSLYETEVQESPLPRSLDSIRALASYRGTAANLSYAEALHLIRRTF